MKRVPTNEGGKGWAHLLKTLFYSSNVKMVQITTDMVLIITNTGEALLRNVNFDDLEPPKLGVLVNFFRISGCDTHLKNELRQNGWR